MGELEKTYGIRTAILAIAFSLLLLGISRATRRLTIKFTGIANRFMPKKLSAVTGVVAVILLYILIFNIVFAKIFIDISNNLYANKNTTTSVSASRPKSDKKSGGPKSRLSAA